jgi:hypothetical protein
VRADTFVFRVSPQGSVHIAVYAMQFGKPVPAGTQIGFVADPSQLQAQTGSGFPFVAPSPPVATPSVLTFSPGAQVATDANGRAVVTVNAADPGSPRNFNIGPTNPTGDYGIDGQVYGVRPGFVDTQTFGNQPINQWDFISFLVWTGFQAKVPAQPTWYDDLQPIFQQYANLYPVMSRFLNLADYESVRANVRLLSLAFGLSVSDPNSMPVTRDLSPAKRAAICLWLQNGMPLGNPPSRAATLTRTAPPPVQPPALGAPPAMSRGGKAAAASRRLVVWQYR